MKNMYCISAILLLLVLSTRAQDYSLNFDGNSYVSVPHNDTLNLSSNLTIECWFTVEGASINDWIGIVCKLDASSVSYSGYFFGLGQNSTYPNHLVFYIYPSGQHINCPFSPTLNQWYNLAVTYNGSVMRMFLDGNLIQETAATGVIASNTFPLTIGGQNGNFWNRNLNGKIDEVRISSVARYETNFIPINYFDYDTNTIALYHLNEGTGDTVFDSSGNNLNGTIFGATWGDGILTVVTEELANPTEYLLSQNYPNPFNPDTKISWQTPTGGHQTLKIFDILGNEVATLVNEFRDAGRYEIEFKSSTGSRHLASGVYFYQLRAGDFIQTKKMLLMK